MKIWSTAYPYVFAAGFLAVASFGAWSLVPVLREPPQPRSTAILDRDGGLLYQTADPQTGVREYVPFGDMPEMLVQALVAAEDRRFYQHHGVDVLALGRTLFNKVAYGAAGGGSTIEQQWVKNSFFPGRRRTVLQKAREMLAALFWSATHSKHYTLERYLNSAYFGNRAYGVAAAARNYFGKSVQDLTTAEIAMIIGQLPSPARSDPYRHWPEAINQQVRVVDRLVATAVLNQQQRNDVMDMPIRVVEIKRTVRAPHFVFAVLEQLEERYADIASGGYEVRTTLDPDMQAAAEAIVKRRLQPLADEQVSNAAVVASDPQTGELLAYVGSADYFDRSISGAVDMAKAKRQPGSALKPFLYFAAFLDGLTPATVIPDLPTRFETSAGRPYYPRNYNYRYFGPVNVRDALGSSLNIPAVRVLDRLGLQSFHNVLAAFGIRFPEPPDHYGLGIVLGGGEVSLADLTNAYATLARYGQALPTVAVLHVRDADGALLEQALTRTPKSLFTTKKHVDQATALVHDILSDPLARALSFGEANALDVGMPVAVKTGTTKDFRDNWAFGYTPDFVVGVWVGNADNRPMQGVTGLSGAVPIWHDIMQFRYAHARPQPWRDVPGITKRRICLPSGFLADDDCLKSRMELFIEGMEPVTYDDWFQGFDIDLKSGQLANETCRARVQRQVFLVPPAEYAAWAKASGWPQPPQQDCSGASVFEGGGAVEILSPLDGDAFVIDPFVDASLQKIPFMIAGGKAPFEWRLNGQTIISQDPTYYWLPQPGDYTLQTNDRQIRFTVR